MTITRGCSVTREQDIPRTGSLSESSKIIPECSSNGPLSGSGCLDDGRACFTLTQVNYGLIPTHQSMSRISKFTHAVV